MNKIIKYIFGLTWLGIVMYFFYVNHPYYLADLPGIMKWWPIWIVPVILYVLFKGWTWITEEKHIRVKLTTLRILSAILITLLVFGNIVFLKLSPLMFTGPTTVITESSDVIYDPTPQQISDAAYLFEYGTTIADNTNFYENAVEIQEHLSRANFWQIQVGLIWTFIKVYGSTAVLLFFAWVLGSSAHLAIRRNKAPPERKFFEAGMIDMVLGLGLLTTILFLLAWFGLFSLPFILGVTAAIFAVLYKGVVKSAKSLWKWEYELELNPKSLVIPVFLFLGTFAVIHLIDNLSPLPRGWDGLNRYIVIARDLALGGELVQRGSVYAWELLLGFAHMLDMKIVLFWTSFPGFLTFILIWLLARRYSSNLGAALAITTIMVMPMMAFHLSDENKIDVAHWLFGTASILSLIKAVSFEEKIKIKDHSYLWIAGLLAGFAFTIKFTGVLIIMALLSTFAFIEGGIIALVAGVLISIGVLSSQGGLGLGTEFTTSEALNMKIMFIGIFGGAIVAAIGYLKKKFTMKSLKSLVILILFILIPMTPWLVKNGIDTNSLSPSNLIVGANEVPIVDFELEVGLCKSTAFFEEYDRYIGYNDNFLLRLIELPWHLTMNDTGAKGAYVDLGFAFLGFLLLALLFYKPNKKTHVIVVMGVVYTLFWLFKANGVTWYGFPLFSLLGVMLAATYTKMAKDWTGRIALTLVLLIWFITALDARFSNFGKASLILSHTNVISYDDVRESIFPYSNELNDFLTENEGLVYKIGTPLGYFIPNYVERTHDDQLLDNFQCSYLSHDKDFDQLRNLLRNIGFRYILYDSYTYTVGLDPEGTLENKLNLFHEFAGDQLIYVIFDDKRGHHLFYLPTDEELAARKFSTNETESTE